MLAKRSRTDKKQIFCQLVVVIVAAQLLLNSCSYRGRAHHDYVFSITGIVTSADGIPLRNVTVFVLLDKPVYRLLTPVVQITTKTDERGWFVLQSISHHVEIDFIVVVRADGYEEVVFQGGGLQPPPFELVMRKACERGADSLKPR